MSGAWALQAPGAWPAALLAALAGCGVLALERVRARRLTRLLGERAAELAAEVAPTVRRARAILAAGALFLGGLALLQPGWGADESPQGGGSADLLLVLDVSRSMLARDVAPDRLSRAQAEIEDLVAVARGDRIGLVVFAGAARLLIPLTEDLPSFERLLELARPGVLPQGGTNLGAAVDVALQALGDARGEHEAIVLLTDGEDLAAEGRAAAARARARGVAVHCIGFGTGGGGRISVPGGNGETFLRDAAGREVVSALDADGLRAIADATGGMYLEAGAESGAMARLHRERLGPLAGRRSSGAAAPLLAPRFQWFLLAAFVCCWLELLLRERRRA